MFHTYKDTFLLLFSLSIKNTKKFPKTHKTLQYYLTHKQTINNTLKPTPTHPIPSLSNSHLTFISSSRFVPHYLSLNFDIP